MRWLAVVLLLTAGLVTGCVDQGPPAELEATVEQDTLRWGSAVSFTIHNVGQSHAEAPITVEIVDLNGTVVRTFEDVTGGRGLPTNGQANVQWNGLNDEGRPVTWGNYTMRVAGYDAQGLVEVERPPNYALDIDPDPKTAPTGSSITFIVKNNGTAWLNGSLMVEAGRSGTTVYENAIDHVSLGPGDTYEMTWSGKHNGENPEAQRYVVGARMQLDSSGSGPSEAVSQDWFELTQA